MPEPEEIQPPSSALRERLDYRPRLTHRQVHTVDSAVIESPNLQSFI